MSHGHSAGRLALFARTKRRRFRFLTLIASTSIMLVAIFLTTGSAISLGQISSPAAIMHAFTDPAGAQGNAASQNAAVSGSGHFIDLSSSAGNLVSNGIPATRDVFAKAAPTQATNPVPSDAAPGINYYFPWYDNVYGLTWLLTAQPAGSGSNMIDMYLGANPMEIGMAIGDGTTTNRRFENRFGGPVRVTAQNSGGLVSERSLFGNAFEEIWATPYANLDSHYYWPVYMGGSANEWVLVSNPMENGEAVKVDLTMVTPTDPDTGYNPPMDKEALLR